MVWMAEQMCPICPLILNSTIYPEFRGIIRVISWAILRKRLPIGRTLAQFSMAMTCNGVYTCALGLRIESGPEYHKRVPE